MLFIIKSNNQNQGILRFMEKDDKIILIQDGVLLAHANNKFISTVKGKEIEILILENDLNLRGIKNNINAKIINYENMVSLIEKNRVFS